MGPSAAAGAEGATEGGPHEDTAHKSPSKTSLLASVSQFNTRSSSHVPVVTHSNGSRVVKGEDVMAVQALAIATQPQSTLYLICDGHCGIDAAAFVSTHMLRLLNNKLPDKLPNFSNGLEVEVFAENVRKAVCQAFFHLDNEWAASGLHAGTTVSIILVTGWLVTCANVGDSSCVLDTGTTILELTKSHRLQDSALERARLKAAHCQLAPLGFHLQGPAKAGEVGVGPLRLWPAGLCVARSVGDMDAGPEVMPLPNIRQVIMPLAGCRLIMASDGLWDVLTLSKACTMTRLKIPADAISALMQAVTRDLRMMDDTTVLVIDLLPPAHVGGWPAVVLKSDLPGGKGKKGGGGDGCGAIFGCFSAEVDEPDSRDVPVASSGHLAYFADVDTLLAYPSLKGMLSRTVIYQSYHLPINGGADFTQHGARPWRPGASGTLQPSSGSRTPNNSRHQLNHTLSPQLSLSKVMSSPTLNHLLLLAEPSNGGSGGGRGNGLTHGHASSGALNVGAASSAVSPLQQPDSSGGGTGSAHRMRSVSQISVAASGESWRGGGGGPGGAGAPQHGGDAAAAALHLSSLGGHSSAAGGLAESVDGVASVNLGLPVDLSRYDSAEIPSSQLASVALPVGVRLDRGGGLLLSVSASPPGGSPRPSSSPKAGGGGSARQLNPALPRPPAAYSRAASSVP